jgi:hypothetical protein
MIPTTFSAQQLGDEPAPLESFPAFSSTPSIADVCTRPKLTR